MDAATRSRLESAYRATTYRVQLDRENVDLRVGQAVPELDRWLAAQRFDRWALITAENPGSQRLREPENRRRRQALQELVVAAGFTWVAGRNLSDAGDWPPEASLLVPGIGREQAVALAAHFGQNAILFGTVTGTPTLVWTD